MAKIESSRYTVALVIIAVVVFLVLTIAAIRLFSTPLTTMRRFPPWLSDCPDFWIKDGDKCKPDPKSSNANGRQVCNNQPGNYNEKVDWNVPAGLEYNLNEGVDFTGKPLNERCKWAQACDVHWEGISDQGCTNNDDYFLRYDNAAN